MLHVEILFENCLITFLLLAHTKRRECDIVKVCWVSKIIQCATVNCPDNVLRPRVLVRAGTFAKLATGANFISF